MARGRDSHEIAHLLNFQFAKRSTPTGPAPRRRHGPRFDAGAWLQANFHFFVTPPKQQPASSDPEPQLDPQLTGLWAIDQLPDWDSVAEVSTWFSSSEPYMCPICLSPPVAPLVTRCGHIFCMLCITRYLSYAGARGYRRCPICPESVYPKDVRPCQTLVCAHHTAAPDDVLEMMLVAREKDSAVPRAVGRADADPNAVPLAKCTPATPGHQCALWRRYQAELAAFAEEALSLEPESLPTIATIQQEIHDRLVALGDMNAPIPRTPECDPALLASLQRLDEIPCPSPPPLPSPPPPPPRPPATAATAATATVREDQGGAGCPKARERSRSLAVAPQGRLLARCGCRFVCGLDGMAGPEEELLGRCIARPSRFPLGLSLGQTPRPLNAVNPRAEHIRTPHAPE
eukprot:GAFH01001414.1.p1 GENE.GAFH01001414.1~~GAFH01001414.1.p1  ORF type:complete len:457 (+),score=28.04 GAFH01001414.1:166-1371(+)